MSPVRTVLTVFVPFTAAYLVSELYRNVNGVIAPGLHQAFDIGPIELGLLSSVFLVGIASAQIPVGVLLDRYGSRRVVSAMMLMAVTGAALFTVPHYPAALGGRLLLGLGLGACWAGAYRSNVLWWPQERLPLVNGALLGLSGLGALAATRPVEAALHVISWQSLFLGLAAVTAAIALLIYTTAPREPESAGDTKSLTLTDTAKDLKRITTHPLFIRIWPVTAMCEGTWLAYQGLWGGVWLRQVVGLMPDAAANVLFAFAFAIVVGQITLSAATELLIRRGAKLESIMQWLIGGFIAVQCAIAAMPGTLPLMLWTLLGFLTAGPILVYAWLTTELPHAWAGRIVSILNLCATLAGFVLQFAVGGLIDLLSSGAATDAVSQRWAFGLLILSQFLAFLWLVASKALFATSEEHEPL
jgi:MFS family permease